MMLHVIKYDIHPDKTEAYAAWAKAALPELLAVLGYVELRGYRPVTGSSQVAVTIEFADLADWTGWIANEEVQRILHDQRALVLNLTTELWGASPNVPEPIRPER